MSSFGCSLIWLINFVTVTSAGYVRDQCYDDVKTMLDNGTLARNDTCFYRDKHGFTYSEPANPVLTIPGCEELCGTGFSWYEDRGPRLSTWLIPVFLLLSNLEVSPLDKRRYLMILHLLGDPIDSLWCLLLKMEAWARCYTTAIANTSGKDQRSKARNLATVLGGFEELIGFYAEPFEIYSALLPASKDRKNKHVDCIVRETAQKLADSRTDERLRTLLATALYFWQVISAFVNTIGGGNTSPPGGRIGIAMFLSWLVPIVLVSNAIGGFASSRTCFDTLERLVRRSGSNQDLWLALKSNVHELEKFESLEHFMDSMCWSGGIYTYRPEKRLPRLSSRRGSYPQSLFLLAIAPLIISAISASVIIWYTPPNGLNCRNLMVICLFVVWCLSGGVTMLIAKLPLEPAMRWRTTLVKDVIVAVPTVALIFLATCGRFNSCWCWSAVYSLGIGARVPLYTTPEFNHYFKTIYPMTVGICLGLQIITFLIMMWGGWEGWGVMRWSEKDKRDEWMRSRREER